MACAIELTSSVLARPGTPTSSACPRQNRAMSTSSTTSRCPTTALATSARSRWAADRAPASRSSASRSSGMARPYGPGRRQEAGRKTGPCRPAATRGWAFPEALEEPYPPGRCPRAAEARPGRRLRKGEVMGGKVSSDSVLLLGASGKSGVARTSSHGHAGTCTAVSEAEKPVAGAGANGPPRGDLSRVASPREPDAQPGLAAAGPASRRPARGARGFPQRSRQVLEGFSCGPRGQPGGPRTVLGPAGSEKRPIRKPLEGRQRPSPTRASTLTRVWNISALRRMFLTLSSCVIGTRGGGGSPLAPPAAVGGRGAVQRRPARGSGTFSEALRCSRPASGCVRE